MKRIIFAFRILKKSALWCLAGFFFACTVPQGRTFVYRSGTYEGFAQGWRGPVHVLVETSPGGIAGIEILEHGEDPFVGGAAMEELLELVLDLNSTEVDCISGATVSSEAFLAAVEDALSQAWQD